MYTCTILACVGDFVFCIMDLILYLTIRATKRRLEHRTFQLPRNSSCSVFTWSIADFHTAYERPWQCYYYGLCWCTAIAVYVPFLFYVTPPMSLNVCSKCLLIGALKYHRMSLLRNYVASQISCRRNFSNPSSEVRHSYRTDEQCSLSFHICKCWKLHREDS